MQRLLLRTGSPALPVLVRRVKGVAFKGGKVCLRGTTTNLDSKRSAGDEAREQEARASVKEDMARDKQQHTPTPITKEDVPPASPLDRVKDGMMGSVQAAVDKAKEIAQRDRDPSVEWGDQATHDTDKFKKVIRMEAEKARETINRDAARWTAGSGSPGGIDMPPPSNQSSPRATRLDAIKGNAARILGRTKDWVSDAVQSAKERASGPLGRLKTRLEEMEDGMQAKAAEERRAVTMKGRRKAAEEQKKKTTRARGEQ